MRNMKIMRRFGPTAQNICFVRKSAGKAATKQILQGAKRRFFLILPHFAHVPSAGELGWPKT